MNVQISITEDLHGHEVASVMTRVGEKTEIPIPKPKLWSPDSPHLYQVRFFILLALAFAGANPQIPYAEAQDCSLVKLVCRHRLQLELYSVWKLLSGFEAVTQHRR